MPSYIDAYGFIFAWRFDYLFWLALGYLCQRKIDLGDFLELSRWLLFGVALTCLISFYGLSLTPYFGLGDYGGFLRQ
jgi:hypothetical protein